MSIKTEIEWFKCNEKLPDFESNTRFLLKLKNSREIIVSEGFDKNYNLFATQMDGLANDIAYGKNEIKYWAHFPELPEFE